VRLMGVLNVTPDSFSDGGLFEDEGLAIARGLQMFAEGADIVDVGGESTKPGAEEVPVDIELRRVLPVVRELAKHGAVSIDTRKATVAREAVANGASLINDVSASLAAVAGETGAAWVAMHMQGSPATMQRYPSYRDVVSEVRDYLTERVTYAAGLGVKEVYVDPGIGFGKTLDHNLSLIAHMSTLVGDSAGIVLGVSRKSFFGELLNIERPGDRLPPALAVTVLAQLAGVDIIRTHDVLPTSQVIRTVEAVLAAQVAALT
jgi:dihydropteroate synthase